MISNGVPEQCMTCHRHVSGFMLNKPGRILLGTRLWYVHLLSNQQMHQLNSTDTMLAEIPRHITDTIHTELPGDPEVYGRADYGEYGARLIDNRAVPVEDVT
ncbi:hypothetical protein PENANT_c029G11382 [Penicillium antarcticum]|uniref:Uncharacterized protein n=1 Tax=Penicillium antarcticum TaxID=416450 RepID=A0A1V6PVY3_9EURO|nr:hypothetical protein PENANT_c029G11382 [Penicillium antarcticum]